MADCIRHRMLDGTIMDGPIHGQDQTCIEWDSGMQKGGRTKPSPQKKNQGGMLVGPSHDDGGIPVIVDGVEPIEVEGGEFIINKKTVDALGEDFLHRLNSTSTPYHPPEQGFQEGQLPIPSKFQLGGRLNYRNKKMKNGGNVQNKRRKVPVQEKWLREGKTKCPVGMVYSNGSCISLSGQENLMSNYRNGGPIKKQAGGSIGSNSPNSLRNKRLKQQRNATRRLNKPGYSTSSTMTSMGHSHQMILDEYGNGSTVGHDHIHEVVNHTVTMTCDGSGKCHTHAK